MTRSYSVLSDHDFEQLVADLMSADEERHYETFKRGPDGGIDLRHIDPDGQIHVVQCKHYLNSTFSQLKTAASVEAKSIQSSEKAFASYRFVASQKLSPAQKAELFKILSPTIRDEGQVLGQDDLEGLLNRHEEIERAHVKLWISSGSQLDRILNASIWNRSQHLRGEIQRSLNKYVETGLFATAKNRLVASRILILSGPPGIGKTTLARMLLADCVCDGFTPIDVSGDVDEANSVIRDAEPQVFFLDDFLGSTFLQDRLAKNEDKRLTMLMRRCAGDPKKLMILSTREHILQQATAVYDALEQAITEPRKLVLELKSYSEVDRGRILYNHIWHSEYVTPAARRQLVNRQAYLPIVKHNSYNPRTIEYVTGLAAYTLTSDDLHDYPAFILTALSNPSLVWRHAFEQQLDDDCRDILIALAAMPRNTCGVDDLETCYAAQRDANGRPSKRHGFRDSLRILDDAFTRSTNVGSTSVLVELSDPGIEDFIAEWLSSDIESATSAVNGAATFDQIEWLRRRVVDAFAGDRRIGLSRLLAVKGIALFDSRSFAWGPILYQWSGETKIRPYTHANQAARILELFDLYESTPRELQDLLDFIERNVASIPSLFERSTIDYYSWQRVVEKSWELSLAPAESINSTIIYLASRAADYSGWDTVNDLVRSLSGILLPATIKAVRRRFRTWLEGQLVDPEQIDNSYEFDQLISIANTLHVNPPKASVKAARRIIDGREDDDESEDRASTRVEQHVASEVEDSEDELSLLFGRFHQEE